MAHGLVIRPLPFAAVSAGSTATGFDASNVGNDLPGLAWKSEEGGNTRNLVIDLGEDVPFDTITLHGMTGALPDWLLIVELATEAEGEFTGTYWTGAANSLLAGSEMPVNDKGRGLWLAPAGAPSSARYVRLVFSALSNAAITVGRVCIGSAIQLGQNFSYGAALGVRPLGSVNFSNRGVPIVRTGAKLRGIGLTCEAATRSEAESLIMPLIERVGNDTGIALVVDPDPDPQRQNRMYFGFLTGDLGAVWAGYERFVWNVNLVAVD